MLNQILKKIIRTGVGRARFLMAGIGFTIAMLLILSAVQIQVNYNELLYGKSNQDTIANFLVVAKVINGNKTGKCIKQRRNRKTGKTAVISKKSACLLPAVSKFLLKAQVTGFPFTPTCFLKVYRTSL